MRTWFRKTFNKQTGGSEASEGQEKGHNISSLYEIVEDHLKSLDYDQLKSVSSDFAQRFAAHQEIISEIVKTPPPRPKKTADAPREAELSNDFVVIDTRSHDAAGLPVNAAGPFSEEAVLAHYDRMIRSQYDRLIDLTMDFLREVTEAEVKRLDDETTALASEVRDLHDVLTAQVRQLGFDLDETRQLHRDLIVSLEERIVEQNRRADLAERRIKILIGAVIGAGLVAGAALVLSLIV